MRRKQLSLPTLLGATALICLLALTVSGQAMPADAVFQGFQPTGDFVVAIDGEVSPDVELLHAERAQAYLLMSNSLPAPILVSLRGAQIQQVNFMKVTRRPDGTADILADANLRQIGTYSVQDQAVTFKVGEKTVQLKEKPALIGDQKLADMITYNPAYGRTASLYTPNDNALASLTKASDVQVKVYFGSWCSVCKRMVPHMLRVDKELADVEGVRFDYVGLPKPQSAKMEGWPKDVTGVPTGIVYIGGKEVGRVTREQWQAPELAIAKLVKASS